MGAYNKKSIILREVVHEPSVLKTFGVRVMVVEEDEVTWVDLYKDYLLNENFLSNKIKAKKIQERAFNYTVINDKMSRKSNSGLLLCCLTPSKSRRLMVEIHEGVCGSHSRGRSLAHKALSTRYVCPYMMTEAHKFFQKYAKCQRFAPVSHRPAEPLNSVTPWPFAR